MASSSSNEVQPPHLVPSANNVGAQAPMLIMRPELLMAARSGNLRLLRDLLNGEDELALPATAATMVVVDVHEASLLIRRPSTDVSLEGASHLSASRPPSPQPPPVTTVLPGATSQGGSVLHVVAACGDSQEFLQCAQLIYDKARHLLQDRCNKNGDTPLHCAARAGNVAMASLLISLAGGGQDTNDDSDARALLRKQNKNGETVLHEAIRFAKEGMVDMLMSADPELARVPDVGTSPLYLAISLGRAGIAQLLHERDGGLSYSGPDGQTALHAAVLREKGMTEMLLGWKRDLAKEVDRFGNTPLHFAASVECSGRDTVLGSSFWFSFSRRMYGMTELLLDADISSVYHPDKDGLFPIHVAASVGRLNIVKILLDKCPECAGLLDVQGRTFLHVAVENTRHNIVAFACKEPRLASVLNMQDDDMNTALHLAVQVGDLHSFGYLIRNRQVFLDLANNKGHTALDVSGSVVNHSGIHYGSNAQSWIHRLLACTTMGGTSCRQDRFQEIYVPKLDQVEESRKMTESTQYLGISSVLLVTITFAAAFAPPGGYRADDHTNGGAPTLAGSYAFSVFVISNTMAFICSSLSTYGLMYSGMTAVDFSIRKKYFTVSLILLRSSVRSMGVAFASGIYVALAPVALVTAITVCCITSAPAVLYGNRYLAHTITQTISLHHRLGLHIWKGLGITVLVNILFEYWSYIIIFGCPAYHLKYQNR